MREKCTTLFRNIQTATCKALEQLDQKEHFVSDSWQRPEVDGADGGGGLTRVMRGGNVFEQAGVNFSEVYGTMSADLASKLTMPAQDVPFYATGVSMVFHPYSPLVPTTHANFRYLEVGDKKWFGGGMDLTPYYIFEEDAQHFHSELKTICDRHHPDYYYDYKEKCDRYFYLPHRGETRGIGGLFFDYLGKDTPDQLDSYYKFLEDIGNNFLSAYAPIVSKRASLPFTDHQKQFQLLRRGRYVEFNLVYDRGTLFGLKTGGRTESILMSLPPVVRWEYQDAFEMGVEEIKLVETLKNPQAWINRERSF
jgi:coproporphyrinogen III oxidase